MDADHAAGAIIQERQRSNLVVDQLRGWSLYRHVGCGCDERHVHHLAHAAGLVLVDVAVGNDPDQTATSTAVSGRALAVTPEPILEMV